MDLIFVIVFVYSNHSAFHSFVIEGFFDQEADLDSFGDVGMYIDEVIEKTVAEKQTED